MIRAAAHDELTYVRCTWLANLLKRRRQTDAQRQRVRNLVERLLNEHVLLELRPGDERDEEIVGWVCYTPMQTTSAVHFVYVRDRVRREGIARALLAAAGVDIARTVLITHETDMLPEVIAAAGVRVQQMRPEEIL